MYVGIRNQGRRSVEANSKLIRRYFEGPSKALLTGKLPKMAKMIEDQNETTDYEPVIDADFEDTPGAVDDLYDAEREIMQAFDADNKDELQDVHWSVKVYRVETEGRKDTPLFSCSPHELPIYDRLIKGYGTGDYKSRIYRDKKLHRVLTYRVEAPMNQTPEIAASPESTAVAQALANQHILLTELVNKVSETQAPPVQNNPMEMIQVMGAMMGTMREIMGPVNQGASNDPMAMLDLFTRGVEMARDMSDGGGETNAMDIIKEVIKTLPLGEMAKALPAPIEQGATTPGPRPAQIPVAQRPAQVQPSPVQPGVQPAPVQPAPTQSAANQAPIEDPILLAVIGYMVNFIDRAEKGSDVELYGNLILDSADREVVEHVLSYPDIDNVLQGAHPGIAKNWEWFSALLDYLDATLTDGAENGSLPEDGQSQHVDQDSAEDVSTETALADETPATDVGGDDVNSERQSGDQGNAAIDVTPSKGGEEKPGSEIEGGGTGTPS